MVWMVDILSSWIKVLTKSELFLAIIGCLPKEARQLLIEGAMNSLREDIDHHHINGEAGEARVDEHVLACLGDEPPMPQLHLCLNLLF